MDQHQLLNSWEVRLYKYVYISADPLAVRGERAQKFAAVRSSVFQRVLYLPLFGFFGSGLEDIECLVARVIGGTVAEVIRRDTSVL